MSEKHETQPILSRRQFLRAAGGLSFLALTPIGRGLFAALDADPKSKVPLFTALPYIQPGPGTGGRDSMLLAWQTVGSEAAFEVRYGEPARALQAARIGRVETISGDRADLRYNYAATVPNLKLGQEYQYQVTCNGRKIANGHFTTRQPRGRNVRFVAFGDNSVGYDSDRAIAYQAYKAHPDFIMNTGDNVYDSGLDHEYAQFFFPVYNAETADARIGAPLLSTVPFYTVLANHDVTKRDAQHHPIADFKKDPDSLAYYTNLYLPLNGPAPSQPTPTMGDEGYFAKFRQAAAERFPRMANYSYDYGDLHFTCLDSNLYIDPTSAALQDWIKTDLNKTHARWKFVVFHHPPFNAGDNHYEEQHMRVLSPLFEAQGVDFVLSGHEHNYQRTRPFRFKPRDISRAAKLGEHNRRIPGDFIIDRNFNGRDVTRPNGIIYITTGAGGNNLYDMDFGDAPEHWRHADDGNADYVDRFISDRHSLSVFDVDGRQLTLTQVDYKGDVVDRIQVTKT